MSAEGLLEVAKPVRFWRIAPFWKWHIIIWLFWVFHAASWDLRGAQRLLNGVYFIIPPKSAGFWKIYFVCPSAYFLLQKKLAKCLKMSGEVPRAPSGWIRALARGSECADARLRLGLFLQGLLEVAKPVQFWRIAPFWKWHIKTWLFWVFYAAFWALRGSQSLLNGVYLIIPPKSAAFWKINFICPSAYFLLQKKLAKCLKMSGEVSRAPSGWICALARGSECAYARPVRPLFAGTARSGKTCPILTYSTILEMAHHNLTVLSILCSFSGP